jgi:hypothetical protein
MIMSRVHSIGAAMICASCASGCLSIGGKTYTNQNPQTETRLTSLESRLRALEQVVMGTSGPSAYSPAATSATWQAP